jgi:hypothetical protein
MVLAKGSWQLDSEATLSCRDLAGGHAVLGSYRLGQYFDGLSGILSSSSRGIRPLLSELKGAQLSRVARAF